MLEKFEEQLEQWVSLIVIKGDDDALFASGYLQGHFSVVLAELEEDGDNSHQDSVWVKLNDKMHQSLALARKELEEHDYQLVFDAWLDLKQRLSA